MRQVLSLVLLAAALLGQAPIACLATGHGAAVPVDHELSGADHSAHHGHVVESQATPAGAVDDAATRDDEGHPPCAAVARCHWSALPQDATVSVQLGGRIFAGSEGAAVRPVEPASRFPTPPPRLLS